MNTVSVELQGAGYGDRLLAAVFAYADESGKPIYFIYNFKRGAYYPFVPAPGTQARDSEGEFRIKAQLGARAPLGSGPGPLVPALGHPAVVAYHDNAQFWTVPGERDGRLDGRHTDTVTEPEPEEYELYDLTLDPIEERNLAHPSYADDRSRALQESMLKLLIEQLDAKRLTPSTGETPGYRPPAIS